METGLCVTPRKRHAVCTLSLLPLMTASRTILFSAATQRLTALDVMRCALSSLDYLRDAAQHRDL